MSTNKRLVIYCTLGERPAMAMQAAQAAGISSTGHIEGGIAAWKRAIGPLA